MVTGTKKSGKPWTIAIRNPRPGHGDEQVFLEMKNRAIATSGDYMQAFTPDRRFHHIINPRTGFSPPELASSSILAPSVAMVDGLATVAYDRIELENPKAVERCPTGAIVWVEGQQFPQLHIPAGSEAA